MSGKLLPVGDPTRPARLEAGQRWQGARGTMYEVVSVDAFRDAEIASETSRTYRVPERVILDRYRYEEPNP